MYCPCCGHQTTSEELRFCSYCGLKLGVIKAALADDEGVPQVLSASKPSVPVPRQRELNVGVFLMFVATMLASVLTNWPGLGLGRATGAAILTLLYLVTLVLSGQITKLFHKMLSWEESEAELASSQRGLCFGATLMFVSTVLIAITSLLMFGRMKTTEFFVGLAFAFPFCLLVSQYLMRGLRYLVEGESGERKVALSRDGSDVQALPAAKTIPVSLFGTQKVQTAEIITPSSITEHTTNLLETK